MRNRYLYLTLILVGLLLATSGMAAGVYLDQSSFSGAEYDGLAAKPGWRYFQAELPKVASQDAFSSGDRDDCATVYYYNDSTWASFYWPLPQDSVDWLAVRFDNDGASACTLQVARVRLCRGYMEGTPDLQIGVFDDDGFGLPGTLLASETIPYDSLPTGNLGWAEADFSSHNLVFGVGTDYHIGMSVNLQVEGDTLSVESDAADGVHSGELRSTSQYDGIWSTIYSATGTDFVFWIEAEVCWSDACYADGDANNDGLGLSVSDMIYLDAFINSGGPEPIPLYSCNLNGDGVVNMADLVIYEDFFVYGLSVFEPYGGYPVPGPCDPTPQPGGSCAGFSVCYPDTHWLFEAYALDPSLDTIYCGNFVPCSADDIDTSTIRVNESIVPISIEVLDEGECPPAVEFAGRVLRLEVPTRDLIQSFGWLIDTSYQQVSVSGMLMSGAPCTAVAQVLVFGHVPGDVNSDGSIDIADLVYLVDFMFNGGPAPPFSLASDLDGSCSSDIADLVYLVDYMFSGGPPPVSCPGR